MNRIILGIDPGFDRLGFGVVRVGSGRTEAFDFGVITSDRKGEFGERLLTLSTDLTELIGQWTPALIALEKLFLTTNQKTAMRVAEARGVILLSAAQAHIPVIEVTPNQVKSAVTGNGRAEKRDVQRMVQYLLELPRLPKPDDAADALAIAITASTMRV